MCCYEDFRGFLGLAEAWNPPPKPMGNMRTTKKCCLFKEYFRVVCFICIQVQNVPPSCSHPFCRYADKMQDKGFQPACLFQRLDLFADMADEIEIEVISMAVTIMKTMFSAMKEKGRCSSYSHWCFRHGSHLRL